MEAPLHQSLIPANEFLQRQHLIRSSSNHSPLQKTNHSLNRKKTHLVKMTLLFMQADGSHGDSAVKRTKARIKKNTMQSSLSSRNISPCQAANRQVFLAKRIKHW